jgi:2-succinyl-5-enolpyruvyl-6-hydroxy-3-cyclohexene-1-carboxylate synthase
LGVIVGGYDLLLRDPGVRESLRPDLILRVGTAPVSALLTDWLAGLDTPHILIDGGGGRWKDHTGAATLFVPADPAGFLQALVSAVSEPSRREPAGDFEPGWVASWSGINSAVEVAIAESLREPSPSSFFEGAIMAELALRIPPGELLFVSNSMPVRDLDTFVPSRENSLLVLGNRGASGIDGIVSTAAGASLASGKRVTAVVGDLAFLHDSNGLASLRELDANVLLIAVNNDGGGIFHFLPIRDHEPAFTPYFATPHGRDLRHLAVFHGIEYRVVDLRGGGLQGIEGGFEGFQAELKSAYLSAGSLVLEILTDRAENRERRSRIVHEIAAVAANTI